MRTRAEISLVYPRWKCFRQLNRPAVHSVLNELKVTVHLDLNQGGHIILENRLPDFSLIFLDLF